MPVFLILSMLLRVALSYPCPRLVLPPPFQLLSLLPVLPMLLVVFSFYTCSFPVPACSPCPTNTLATIILPYLLLTFSCRLSLYYPNYCSYSSPIPVPCLLSSLLLVLHMLLLLFFFYTSSLSAPAPSPCSIHVTAPIFFYTCSFSAPFPSLCPIHAPASY